MLSSPFRRLKLISFAASLIFTVLLVSAYALPTARAADIVISDIPSCEAAGAQWRSSTCDFRSATYTLAAGDTITATVDIAFDYLVNNGSINARSLYIDESFVNNSGAVITTNRRFSLTGSSGTNYGIINGNIDNYGTVTNNCPGVINGSVTGPGTFIDNCAPPTNTPTNTPLPTNTSTPTNTATQVPPTATNTPSNTPTEVPPTVTNTPTNTAVPPTATFTSTPVPPSATPTPSGVAKVQFNHGNEISVTKNERPNIIFQFGSASGKPLTNARLECSISGQARFITPVDKNGFSTVTVNSAKTTLTFSGRASVPKGQNFSATFKVNPGATVGQSSTLTCTLLGDNFAAVSDTLNIRVR